MADYACHRRQISLEGNSIRTRVGGERCSGCPVFMFDARCSDDLNAFSDHVQDKSETIGKSEHVFVLFERLFVFGEQCSLPTLPF